MIILDTDHITVLKYAEGAEYGVVSARMASSVDRKFSTTAITLEEHMRGWLSHIKRAKNVHCEVKGYDELIDLARFFGGWPIVRFSEAAADQFGTLRQQKIRIGTMDLKIASIALAEDALLLSANLGDFQQVPNLRVEDWLH